MKWILSLLMVSSLFSCKTPWKGEEDLSPMMLNRKAPLEGRHCESSALLNCLNYQGFSFTEEMIAGGGGAMGFIYQKGKFPFLGGRSLTMVPVFLESAGIPLHYVKAPEERESWWDLEALLQQDIPVVLRVDMRYLPYKFGGKYGSRHMSFGWHMITLYGIDPKRSVALVSDTDLPGLQEIRLKDLHRARYSNCDFLPPQGDYYWIEKASENYRTDWQTLTDNAIIEWIKNYQALSESPQELGGIEGLKNFPAVISHIDREIPGYLLPIVLESFYGWIETNGTGGAAFRVFSRDFLVQMEEKTHDPPLEEAIMLLDGSVDYWRSLAKIFRDISKENLKDPGLITELLLKASKAAESLYQKENELYTYLTEKWEG